MNMRAFLLGILAQLIFLTGCSSEKDTLITIKTRHGDILAVLYDQTPAHKSNFIELAKSGRFDSTEFHRVIENFMIQGGDVFSKEGLPEADQYTLPSEEHKELIHEKGAIAAARQGDRVNPEKRSSGCQFYIVQGKVYNELELTTDMKRLRENFMSFIGLNRNQSLAQQYEEMYEFGDFSGINELMLSKKEEMEQFYNINLDKKLSPKQITTYTTMGGTPHLDEGYTVFGKVVKGMEVVEKIASEKTGDQDKPIDPVYITVTAKEMAKKKITKEYGFEYAE